MKSGKWFIILLVASSVSSAETHLLSAEMVMEGPPISIAEIAPLRLKLIRNPGAVVAANQPLSALEPSLNITDSSNYASYQEAGCFRLTGASGATVRMELNNGNPVEIELSDPETGAMATLPSAELKLAMSAGDSCEISGFPTDNQLHSAQIILPSSGEQYVTWAYALNGIPYEVVINQWADDALLSATVDLSAVYEE